jgi:quercetin dioxygenase-like cupin family protein
MSKRSPTLSATLAALAAVALLAPTADSAEAPVRGQHHFSLKANRTATAQAAGVDPEVALSGDDTEGRFTLQDETWDPKFNVPLHFHKRHGETFYIVDGKVEWTVGGETQVMTKGDLVYIPANTPHKVRVLDGKPLHTLFVSSPGGYEDLGAVTRHFSKEALDSPIAKTFAEKLGDFHPLPDDTPIPPDNVGPMPHKGQHHFAMHDKVRIAHNPSGSVDSKILVSGIDGEGLYTIQDENWPADFNVNLHYHARHWEVFYLLGGQIEWTVGGETHLMNPGDLAYVPPNTPHKVHVVGGKDANILFFYGSGGYETTVDIPNEFPKKELERPAAKAAMTALEDFNRLQDPNPYKPPKK